MTSPAWRKPTAKQQEIATNARALALRVFMLCAVIGALFGLVDLLSALLLALMLWLIFDAITLGAWFVLCWLSR